MDYPIGRQLMELAAALLWGGGLGLLYDVFRAFRRLLGLTAFLDLLFCASAALWLFTLGMDVGGGKLTLPMLGTAALGAGLYFAGPGAIVRRGCDWLTESIRAVLRRAFRRKKKENNKEE